MLIGLLLTSCYSTRFVDSWKNEQITSFKPDKMLVIGITDNLTARKIFEEEMTNALVTRNINAIESSAILQKSFTDSKKSEEEIDALKQQLISDGFDAVAITAVIGVDELRSYNSGFYSFGFNWYRFGPYYYRFQNVYYTPEYYSDYKVFHIETSIYNLTADEDKSLVWVGTFKITDPTSISSTVEDYVNRILLQLEREGVIQKMNGKP